MVESTCLKEKCYIYREEGDKCPFYVETIWTVEGSHEPKIAEDCAPRRNTMMLMDYSNRAIGIQQDYEQQRNMYAEVLKGVGQVVTAMQKRNEMLQEHLGIDHKDDPKLIFSEDKEN